MKRWITAAALLAATLTFGAPAAQAQMPAGEARVELANHWYGGGSRYYARSCGPRSYYQPRSYYRPYRSYNYSYRPRYYYSRPRYYAPRYCY